MSTQNGPMAITTYRCTGCAYLHEDRSGRVAGECENVCRAPGGTPRVIGINVWATPEWCPVLAQARRDIEGANRAGLAVLARRST